MLSMTSSEQLELDVINKVNSNKITIKQAMQILNKSESTIYRKLSKLRNEGVSFVKHGNCNKTPKNKTCSTLEAKIIDLCKNKYKNYNRVHAWEEMSSNEGLDLPLNTFKNICKRNNLLMKNVKSKRRSKPRHRRRRMKQKGIMIQLDGSPHRWFGRKKTCLVIAIDDATSDPLYGEFSPTETTFACMNVIKKVLNKFGAFQILYTDKAGIFGKDPINHFDAVKRSGFSSLQECLLKFDINTIHAQSPEAKGRVERCFKTLQDRLVAEMETYNIRTIEEANRYLNDVYLKKHRENFAIEAKDQKLAFTKILPSINLDEFFYMKQTRKIKNDHTFSLGNIIYDIETYEKNLSGKEIEIRSYPCGKVLYFVDDEEVRLKEEKEAVS